MVLGIGHVFTVVVLVVLKVRERKGEVRPNQNIERRWSSYTIVNRQETGVQCPDCRR